MTSKENLTERYEKNSSEYISNERSEPGCEIGAASLIIGGIAMGICSEDLASRILEGGFIMGGIGTLWMGGYSPLKFGEEIIRGVGKLACYPYDYIHAQKKC